MILHIWKTSRGVIDGGHGTVFSAIALYYEVFLSTCGCLGNRSMVKQQHMEENKEVYIHFSPPLLVPVLAHLSSLNGGYSSASLYQEKHASTCSQDGLRIPLNAMILYLQRSSGNTRIRIKRNKSGNEAVLSRVAITDMRFRQGARLNQDIPARLGRC